MGMTEGGYGQEAHEFAALHPPKEGAKPFVEVFSAIDPAKAVRLLLHPDFIAIASLREMGDWGYTPSGLQDLYHDAVGPSLNALEHQLRSEEFTAGELWSGLAVARGEVESPEVTEDMFTESELVEIFERLNRAYEQNVPEMMEEAEAEREESSREFRAARELEKLNRLKALQTPEPAKRRYFQIVEDIVKRIRRRKNQDEA